MASVSDWPPVRLDDYQLSLTGHIAFMRRTIDRRLGAVDRAATPEGPWAAEVRGVRGELAYALFRGIEWGHLLDVSKPGKWDFDEGGTTLDVKCGGKPAICVEEQQTVAKGEFIVGVWERWPGEYAILGYTTPDEAKQPQFRQTGGYYRVPAHDLRPISGLTNLIRERQTAP
jgi:hypothetical protein